MMSTKTFTLLFSLLLLSVVSLQAQAVSSNEGGVSIRADNTLDTKADFVASLNLDAAQQAEFAALEVEHQDRLAQIASENAGDDARIAMISREVDALYLNKMADFLNDGQRAALGAYRQQQNRKARAAGQR